jgi:predicted protein tyrosine phosphatase
MGNVLEGSIVKPLHPYSAMKISRNRLPGPSAVVRMADERDLLAPIYDQENVAASLDCIFADNEGAPTADDAMRIAQFLNDAALNTRVEHIVAQCQVGIGRSVAVCAAYAAAHGRRWEEMAVYNRTLYKLLLTEFGIPIPSEPLVSLAVRVKYDAATLMGFLLSLQRQRYDNWQAVLFTDGLRPDVQSLIGSITGANIVLAQNSIAKGRWGHPYRQIALELCEGDWIGTNNDDNYLTPGYIEQLVRAGERSGAGVVVCPAVHRYSGWGVCRAGDDLACWIARRDIVRQVTWDDYSFTGDAAYLKKLIEAANGKVAEVPRMLVVKN